MDECKNCGYAIEFRLYAFAAPNGSFWRHMGTRLMACDLDDPNTEFAEPK